MSFNIDKDRLALISTEKLLILSSLMFLASVLVGQEPHDLLNQWHTNSVDEQSYSQCNQWKITYPDGSSEKDLCYTVDGDDQEYYYVNSAGDGIVFRVPIRSNNGTTPNSKNVRSELRELKEDGSGRIFWTTQGNHVIYVKQAITHLTMRKPHIVATQIHGNKEEGIDDSMVLRLDQDHLYLNLNGGKLRDSITIKRGYQLGTIHEVIFQVIDGKHYCYYSEDGKLKDAFINRSAGRYLVKDGKDPVLMDLNYGDVYFKAGNYTQSNKGREGDATDDPNNYSEVVIFDLVVDHHGDRTPE